MAGMSNTDAAYAVAESHSDRSVKSADEARRALLAERYQTVITPDPAAPDYARQQTIAAIHGLAQWLTQHPDWPAPFAVQLSSHASPEEINKLAAAGYGEVVASLDGRSMLLTEPPRFPGLLYSTIGVSEPVRAL